MFSAVAVCSTIIKGRTSYNSNINSINLLINSRSDLNSLKILNVLEKFASMDIL